MPNINNTPEGVDQETPELEVSIEEQDAMREAGVSGESGMLSVEEGEVLKRDIIEDGEGAEDNLEGRPEIVKEETHMILDLLGVEEAVNEMLEKHKEEETDDDAAAVEKDHEIDEIDPEALEMSVLGKINESFSRRTRAMMLGSVFAGLLTAGMTYSQDAEASNWSQCRSYNIEYQVECNKQMDRIAMQEEIRAARHWGIEDARAQRPSRESAYRTEHEARAYERAYKSESRRMARADTRQRGQYRGGQYRGGQYRGRQTRLQKGLIREFRRIARDAAYGRKINERDAVRVLDRVVRDIFR